MDILKRLEYDEYNTQLWSECVHKSLDHFRNKKQSIELVRTVFEKFFEKFPTCAKYWILYMEFEIKHVGEKTKIQELFSKCLLQVPHLGLWKIYLDFIRSNNPLEQPQSASEWTDEVEKNNRLTVGRAYEFALEHIGFDIDSGSIWQAYLEFLQSHTATTPKEESQKMDLIRHTYSRALVIPLTDIEMLWRSYDAFENGLNKTLAKKLVSERSSGYMNARSSVRELSSMLTHAKRLAETWIPGQPSWSDQECQLLLLWRRYIAWERRNPLQLPSNTQVMKRCTFAFRLALMTHYRFPEIWLDFAEFFLENEHTADGMDVFKAAFAAAPTSLLLRFKYAEVLEQSGTPFAEIATVFTDALGALEASKKQVSLQCESKKHHIKISASSFSAAGNDMMVDGDSKERARVLEQAVKDEKNALEDVRDTELARIDEAFALLWICYIRTGRRCNGIRSARSLFSQARKTADCQFQVYVACAMLEYRCSKSAQIAERIFELGWKVFIDSYNQRMVEKAASGSKVLRALDAIDAQRGADFAYFYLHFVMQLNDESNTRALFERIVANVAANNLKRVWLLFIEFEQQYGDFGNLQRVLSRYKESFGDSLEFFEELDQAAAQYDCFDISVIRERELGVTSWTSYVAAHEDERFALKTSAEGSSSLANTANKPSVMLSVTPEKFARPNIDGDDSCWIPHQPEPLQILENGDMLTGETGEEVSVLVPEPVAGLLAQLPNATEFSGPIIFADELLALLQVVPMPASPANGGDSLVMVPAPAPHYRKQVIAQAPSYSPAISVLSQITGLNFIVPPPSASAPHMLPLNSAVPPPASMSVRKQPSRVSTPSGATRSRASNKRTRTGE